jgi:hypothetical protein
MLLLILGLSTQNVNPCKLSPSGRFLLVAIHLPMNRVRVEGRSSPKNAAWFPTHRTQALLQASYLGFTVYRLMAGFM